MRKLVKSFYKKIISLFFIIILSTNVSNPKSFEKKIEDFKYVTEYMDTIEFFNKLGYSIPNTLPIHLPFNIENIHRISGKFMEFRKYPIPHSHKGIDFSGKKGSPIVAAGTGIVVRAGYGIGYGKLVIIQHENNLQTIYAHLDKILVSEGDKVNFGQQIGTLGNTGWSTGPHLHYEVRKNNKPIDPLTFYNLDSITLKGLLERAQFYKTNFLWMQK